MIGFDAYGEGETGVRGDDVLRRPGQVCHEGVVVDLGRRVGDAQGDPVSAVVDGPVDGLRDGRAVRRVGLGKGGG